MNSASRLNARCRKWPWMNVYVTNVQGRASASSGANPNVATNHGLTKIVIWSRKTIRLATISRRTHGVIPNIRCGTISYLSPARAPRVPPPGQSTDPLAQLGELDPRRPGALGQEALPRHPGNRVGLETKDVALGAQPEVNTRISPELERPVGRARQLLQLTRQGRVELGGKALLRHPRRVLALVVEQLVLRDDLPHGERHVAQHSDGQLPPRHELLDHDLRVVRPCQCDRGVQPLRVAHQRH